MFWPSLGSEFEGPRAMSSFSRTETVHAPIMVKEVLEHLGCRPGASFIDLTVGGGGHAEAILNATTPDGLVVGVDRDPAALGRAGERLRVFGRRVKLLHGNIGNVSDVLLAAGLERVDGVLMDCGISSDQLADVSRGFSFQTEGPLDMRMDPTTGRAAASWLARATEREIADALFRFGEEHRSRSIARRIVAERKKSPIATTDRLARIVRAVVGRGTSRLIDPATKTFQALRILTNDELGEIERGLSELLRVLSSGARIVVITFHSLEDRIVKNLFRDAAKRGAVELLTKKVVRPSEEEVRKNPRSRSAVLRAAELTRGRA